MRTIILTSAVALGALMASCASSEEPGTVEKSSSAYRNTFDFVWQSAQDELASSWKIESADTKTKTIKTGWNTNLSPFSAHGMRNRLIVTVIGDGQCGWRANARQESEMNANEKNPLAEAEAKWKPAENDGGLAAKFLQNLDTRLQPDERWRDRLAR